MITAVVLWWLIGYISFIYWYRHDYDITMKELLFGTVVGVLGPIAFLVGWGIHSPNEPRIIFRKKE